MATNAAVSYDAGFIRVSNEKIRSLIRSDSVCGIHSLRELGLYSLLSAILSNPSFVSANGGLQSLLLKHCKNRYYSLHGSWKQLIALGLLKRTRVPLGSNRFRDFYDLLHTPDMTLSPVTYLSASEGEIFGKTRVSFVPPTEDFTMVSFSMLMDSRLSLSAKGLYALIARKLRLVKCIPGEQFTKDILFRSCREGRNAFDSLWKELRDCGYLVLTRVWDSVRKKTCFRYTLNPSAAVSDVSVPEKNESCVSHTSVRSDVSTFPITEREVQEQIDYESVVESYPPDRVKILVSILLEQYRYAAKSPGKIIRLGNERVSASELARNLRSLHGDEICYILDTYSSAAKKSKIQNPGKYLLSCLYHASSDYQIHLETTLSEIGIS